LKVTLKTIADSVGVSVTTVSRVLNGQTKKYRISSETETLILNKSKEFGYLPDQLARSLRINKSNIIGLIIPDISNPFFASLARVIENEARKKNYSIILSDTQEDIQLEVESINLLLSRKVDGVIICPTGNTDNYNHIEKLIKTNLPIVIVDRHIPGLKCPFVISDNFQGAYEATKYLLQKNHQNIACIQGPPNTSVNDNRVNGFKKALNEKQINFNDASIIGDSFGERNGYVSAKMLLSKIPRPSAIFACSNLISLGAIRAIFEEGLKIPADISMISFDDQPYSEFLATPMTVVVQQTREMGQIGFKLLFARLNHGSPQSSEGVILPTKLVKRKSVIDFMYNSINDDKKNNIQISGSISN
jgi:LacI family transcriptional regulator